MKREKILRILSTNRSKTCPVKIKPAYAPPQDQFESRVPHRLAAMKVQRLSCARTDLEFHVKSESDEGHSNLNKKPMSVDRALIGKITLGQDTKPERAHQKRDLAIRNNSGGHGVFGHGKSVKGLSVVKDANAPQKPADPFNFADPNSNEVQSQTVLSTTGYPPKSADQTPQESTHSAQPRLRPSSKKPRSQPVGSLAGLLRMTAAATMLLCQVAQGEEESILTSNVIVKDEGNYDTDYPEPGQLITGCFKNMAIRQDNSELQQEIMIEFPESQAIHTIFIALPAKNQREQKKFGVSHVRVGDDDTPYNTNNAMVASGMTSGGFHEVTSIVSGKYLTVRRDDIDGSSQDYYWQQLRVYQTPNLIKLYNGSLAFTSDTSEHFDSLYTTDNLINNLNLRTSGNGKRAVDNPDDDGQVSRIDDKACFKVDYAEIRKENKMIIGIDFSESVFIHAVLHHQDNIQDNDSWVQTTSELHNLFQNYEIYIGDNSSYSQNAKCAGGPFLAPADSTSYILDQRAYDEPVDPFGKGQGMVWRFGLENWCNLQGQYMYMVADLTEHANDTGGVADSEEISICSIGVFGTKYERVGEPLAASIVMTQNEVQSFEVARITSSVAIGTTLDIKLRQSVPSLSFVSFVEAAASSSVIIYGFGVPAGEYTLVLESYNALSAAQSTLMTDTISITMNEEVVAIVVPPSFLSELDMQIVTAGMGAMWSLPDIDPGSAELREVQVQPDILLTPFIQYQAESRTIMFLEDPTTSTLVGEFPVVYVKLISVDDVESDYFFLVQVFAPIVEEFIPPSFFMPLDDQVVLAGSGASWILPDIDPGTQELLDVQVTPDMELVPFITFESVSRTVVLAEDPMTSELAGLFYQVQVKLVGSGDVQSDYSFTVEIQEAPQEEEPAGAIEDAPAGEGDLIEPAAAADINPPAAAIPSSSVVTGAPIVEAVVSDPIYEEVPLTERLESGVSNLFGLIAEQRLSARKSAASSGGVLPPDMQIGEISADGAVNVKFTNQMDFPSTREFVLDNEKSNNKLLNVMMLSGEDEAIDPNLLSWTINTVSSQLIEIKLEFERPLEISQGDEPEKLVVQAGLSRYLDQHLQRLEKSIVRMKDVPRQIGSASEAAAMASTGAATSSAAIGASAVQLIVAFVMQAGLGQLWSMLNSQQIIVYMPMLEKLKFPANAMLITKELIKVASFDLIPTDIIDEQLWYFPEGDPFSLNFNTAGIESTMFFANIGLIFYMIVFNVFLIVLHIFFFTAKNSCNCAQKGRKKVGDYLYFNGSIRFFMEVYFDVALLSALNLETVDWNTLFPSEKISNAMSIFFLVVIGLGPLCFALLVCWDTKRWRQEKFQDKFGAILEGTSEKMQKQGKRMLFLVPLIFFMKRVSFLIAVLVLKELIWAQLAMQTFVSLGMCMFLQWFRPLESEFANNIETFNDATVLVLTYFLFCFTDFVSEAEMKSKMGLYYICIGLGNMATHLFIMFGSSFIACRLSCKKKRHQKKLKIHLEKLIAQKKVDLQALQSGDQTQRTNSLVQSKFKASNQTVQVQQAEEPDDRVEQEEPQDKLLSISEVEYSQNEYEEEEKKPRYHPANVENIVDNLNSYSMFMADMEKNMSFLDDLISGTTPEIKPATSKAKDSLNGYGQEEEKQSVRPTDMDLQVNKLNDFNSFIEDMEKNMSMIDDLYPVKESRTKQAIEKQLEGQTTSRLPLIQEEEDD